MSATISTAPNPATPTVQALLTGVSEPGATLDSSDASDAGQFTALFQQLLSGQLAIDAAAQPGLLPAETVVATASVDPGAALAALLPFIEALGLTQNAAAASADIEENLLKEDSAGSPLAGLAAALTAQSASKTAISAANSAAEDGGRRPAAALTYATALSLRAADKDGASTSSRGASAVGEFSSQLATALNSGGDKTILHLPGNPGGQSGLHPAQSSTAPMPALPVAQTVGAPGWGQEVGNRIVWMASRVESRAELVLTPPHMGRVEVSLTVFGDQASAIFTSANPAVREALEAAMPRLRELLADAGIQLGQAQVGAENARQSAQQEKNGDNFGNRHGANSDAGPFQTITDTPLTPSGLKMGRGLVDVFA